MRQETQPRGLETFDRLLEPVANPTIGEILDLVRQYEAEGMERGDAHRRAYVELSSRPRPKTWQISVFRDAMTRQPRSVSARWSTFQELFTYFYQMPSGDKLRARCWSPATFNGTRAAANVETVSALVFDFDDGTRIEHVRALLAGLSHIGHTSWSHTEDHHKFRVIIPMAEPVPGRLWRQFYRWALKTWEDLKDPGVGSPDPQCSDPSRLYLVPVWREGQPRVTWYDRPHADGSTGFFHVPPEALAEKPPPPPPRRLPPVDIGHGDLEREARKRCKVDPGTREQLAQALGATIRQGIARGIRCPNCGRASVWYGIDGQLSSSARCNHANSCGWWGSVYDTATHNGIRL